MKLEEPSSTCLDWWVVLRSRVPLTEAEYLELEMSMNSLINVLSPQKAMTNGDSALFTGA